MTAIHGNGPYLATNSIATMLAHGFLSSDVGIVGLGSLANITYLCGGSGTFKSPGLLPTCTDSTWNYNYSSSGSARGMPLVGHAAFFALLP